MNYSTQMDAAKKGILTKQMKEVLLEEKHINENWLLEKVASGKIVIPANINHKSIIGKGVGDGLLTKVNVNLGVSEACNNMDLEIEKVKNAINLKADSIMDLSIFGDTRKFRRKLVDISPVMLGTVPMYDAVAKLGKNVKNMSVDDLFRVTEEHMEDGIDFLTIHAGLNRTCIERISKNKRLTHIVSRGGSILYEWMLKNDKENPFYENYDRLLELCKKYDVTLSLGDGLRPGSIKDSTDAPQIQELIILGELTKEAWTQNVQVMIEGPGHVPINEIVTNMQIQKKLCHGAPFYILGPVVTDIAPGYDHITSAIGGTLAATAGANFLCYVTPAEHLRLPDVNDVKEGLITARIAAHAADIANGIPHAIEWDHAMSKARKDLDWEKMYELAIDEEKAREYRKNTNDMEACSMCGDMCPMKRANDNNF
ncbi:MAG: phosphomethylpyrimidine synthase ThiC [Fusobacteriaceae bacterium]|nr:phosphomethylpyrimidine synthase ThiC [Fusobacteriaceae bacterium]